MLTSDIWKKIAESGFWEEEGRKIKKLQREQEAETRKAELELDWVRARFNVDAGVLGLPFAPSRAEVKAVYKSAGFSDAEVALIDPEVRETVKIQQAEKRRERRRMEVVELTRRRVLRQLSQ